MNRRSFLGAAAMTATAVAANPAAASTAGNPFLEAWTLPHGAPPFNRITNAHFLPAFEHGMAVRRAEIEAVANSTAAPTFANTIEALERGGEVLDKVSNVFFNLSSSNTDSDIQAIQREISPKLAAFRNEMLLNDKLFARVDGLYQRRARLGLSAEQVRVLERYHVMFVRAGAKLAPAQKDRIKEIDQQLSTLTVQFQQNQLADTNAFVLELKTEADMAGLPQDARDAAAAAAKARKLDVPGVITLSRSSVEPFLQMSDRRDLREIAFKAWAARGNNDNQWDNKKIIAQVLALRAERAKILGYDTFAQFVIDDRMAKTPQAARGLIERVWEPARKRAEEERADMQALIKAEGGAYALEGWDWRYYAEKVRKARFDLDQEEVKPYFQLDKMIEASFWTASQLWGLSFSEVKGLPTYHPDVRVWAVMDADKSFIGLFYGDYFARPSKQSGAWMSSFRDQQMLSGKVTPVVVNVLNYNKPPAGQAALLSYDDAETLFHEFGHALHGLLSRVKYPFISGTSVPTDFVEFPAQVYEHWLGEPAILSRFAVHHQTGEALPKALLDKIVASSKFNQGFATTEFLASAIVDMDLHEMASVDPATFDINAAEAATLARLKMPKEIVCRHRPTHFGHIFAGGYAAGYYSYMWSEVLDADGFEAFKETGDIFNKEKAARLRQHVYAAGGTQEPMALYVAFRGREPAVDALLRNRGFAV
jgi:peptidyl-dipeptidase Dcp